MKKADLFYKEYYIGTLYENGSVTYALTSDLAEFVPMKKMIDKLEMMREIGKDSNFDFQHYVDGHNNFPFKDGFEFK